MNLDKLEQIENYKYLVEMKNISSDKITNFHVKEFVDVYCIMVKNNERLFNNVEYLLGNGIGRVNKFRKMKTIDDFYKSKISNYFSHCIYDLETCFKKANN